MRLRSDATSPGPARRSRIPRLSTSLERSLQLAATPSFAAAALVTAYADRANAAAWCGVAAPHGNAMIVMYLLMSVFHSPAWLRRRPERAASAHGIDPDA